MIVGPRAAVDVSIGKRLTVRVALVELDDVRDVGPSPLVDRLIVVADDAEVHGVGGEQLDQRLLRRVDVLVLVDDQVAQRRVDGREDLRPRELRDRARDLCPYVRKRLSSSDGEVALVDLAERVVELVRLEQLVLDHLEVRQERRDRLEERAVELLEPDVVAPRA